MKRRLGTVALSIVALRDLIDSSPSAVEPRLLAESLVKQALAVITSWSTQEISIERRFIPEQWSFRSIRCRFVAEIQWIVESVCGDVLEIRALDDTIGDCAEVTKCKVSNLRTPSGH